MNDKMQRLELENMLSQIYSNDYTFDGPMSMLSFGNINFITLNSSDIYVHKCDIRFHRKCLNILIDFATIEIQYSDIEYLSINFREA
jgi:hypothetical protein